MVQVKFKPVPFDTCTKMNTIFVLTALTFCCGLASGFTAVPPRTATVNATMKPDGSMEVRTPAAIYTIPGSMLTLTTALLNLVKDTVNKAQTTGAATVTVPNTSKGDLTFVKVNGVEYSFYASAQLTNLNVGLLAVQEVLSYLASQYFDYFFG